MNNLVLIPNVPTMIRWLNSMPASERAEVLAHFAAETPATPVKRVTKPRAPKTMGRRQLDVSHLGYGVDVFETTFRHDDSDRLAAWLESHHDPKWQHTLKITVGESKPKALSDKARIAETERWNSLAAKLNKKAGLS